MPPSALPYIDLYFGYLNAPAVGRSVLGDAVYQNMMSRLKPGEHAIFMIAHGAGSFKGSGFVRGGIYDRVQVAQDMDSFTFRDQEYLPLYKIEAAGAPPLPGVGHLHHPLAAIQRGLSLASGTSGQQGGQSDG
jgi:NosR/NirI family nitrous oxide reductase transcriptional regulator